MTSIALAMLWIGLVRRSAHPLRVDFPRVEVLKPGNRWLLAGSIWLIAVVLVVPLYLFFDVTRDHLLAAGGRGGWVASPGDPSIG